MLRQFIAWLEAGKKMPDELLALCLRRIAECEPGVRAWVQIAPQPPLGDGPLRGIPFGAKDIFETSGLVTAYGSPLYEGRQGERDSAAVQHLRRAGAVLLGKTHTTAFASFDPAPTRNPRLPGHTPGGSSAGSAAAVAAGMVPFALGTQTLGSVLRPASYCGVCGFKPGHGVVPIDGALAFAPSLDTAGLFTETAAGMACLWPRAFGAAVDVELENAVRFRIPADPPMTRAIEDAAQRLRAHGIRVVDLDPPDGWAALGAAARLINAYEGACSHRARYEQFGERIGHRLAELVRSGLETSGDDYRAALACVGRMKAQMAGVFREYPAILSPAATGPAPAGFASTGDPANNAPWTALGVPAISVPLPVNGAPLGLQITAAVGRDDALVAIASQVERLLA